MISVMPTLNRHDREQHVAAATRRVLRAAVDHQDRKIPGEPLGVTPIATETRRENGLSFPRPLDRPSFGRWPVSAWGKGVAP